MLHLLHLEWLKSRNNNALRVAAILYLALMPLVPLMVRGDDNSGGDSLLRFQDLVAFPTAFAFLGYIGSWVGFILIGYLSIQLIAQEYSYRTARQNVMDGLSRHEFLLSKLFAILFLALAATLWYALVALGYGLLYTETIYASAVQKLGPNALRYFLMMLGYASFAALLAFLTRRSGLSILLYLAYIFFLEPILRWGIHNNIAPSRAIHFYPLNAIEDLMPPPLASQFINVVGNAQGDSSTLYLSATEASISTLVYVTLFWLAAYKLFQQRDL
jgi:ABC-2 type transport system permease protein